MSETGFQLLARLCARPSLRNLWADTLFIGGLDPGECVEVTSDEVGGGKTEFLLNVTAKCIQPEVYGDLDIEGGRDCLREASNIYKRVTWLDIYKERELQAS